MAEGHQTDSVLIIGVCLAVQTTDGNWQTSKGNSKKGAQVRIHSGWDAKVKVLLKSRGNKRNKFKLKLMMTKRGGRGEKRIR